MSLENPFSAEPVSNYAQKCCVSLVLDTSGSMEENGRILQLAEGVAAFVDEISRDSANLAQKLEIGIVTFGKDVQRVVEPSLVQGLALPSFKTDGSTRLVDAVEEGIRMVQQRKAWYRSTGQKYYRPWVILITDGEPDADQRPRLPGLAEQIRRGMEQKDFCFMAIGVEKADFAVLDSISTTEIKPKFIAGLRFAQFFKWLSATIAEVNKGRDVASTVMNSSKDWSGGFKI